MDHWVEITVVLSAGWEEYRINALVQNVVQVLCWRRNKELR